MVTLKKKLAVVIFLAFFATATLVSCGTQSNKEEQTSDEHPTDSTEHPEGEHPEGEHPTDSTENQ